MSKKTQVTSIPNCDICVLKRNPPTPAYADCLIPSLSTWGNVCKNHFYIMNCKLGDGLGQELELIEPDPEPQSQTERIRERVKNIDKDVPLSIQDFEDIFEDRDPAEFL